MLRSSLFLPPTSSPTSASGSTLAMLRIRHLLCSPHCQSPPSLGVLQQPTGLRSALTHSQRENTVLLNRFWAGPLPPMLPWLLPHADKNPSPYPTWLYPLSSPPTTLLLIPCNPATQAMPSRTLVLAVPSAKMPSSSRFLAFAHWLREAS